MTNEPNGFTRAEHLAWSKERALAYVDQGDNGNAFASLVADLRNHSQTADHGAIELGAMLLFGGHLATRQQMREFIEGVQ